MENTNVLNSTTNDFSKTFEYSELIENLFNDFFRKCVKSLSNGKYELEDLYDSMLKEHSDLNKGVIVLKDEDSAEKFVSKLRGNILTVS